MDTEFSVEGEQWDYRHTLSPQPSPTAAFMHAHDTCEILYFISGKGTYFVESTSYNLAPGCVMLMRPGEVHKLQIDPSVPYERIVLQFHENRLLHLGDHHRLLLSPFTRRTLGQFNQYRPEEYDSDFVLKSLLRIEEAADPTMRDLIVEAALTATLSEFCKIHRFRLSLGDTQNKTPNSRMHEILLYVNDNLFNDLSLDSICQHFSISKTQLGRHFRMLTGSTAWEYILAKRLVEARRQILSGVPVTDASQACGFWDYSAFYRAYKKRYGCSPTVDRRRTVRK